VTASNLIEKKVEEVEEVYAGKLSLTM